MSLSRRCLWTCLVSLSTIVSFSSSTSVFSGQTRTGNSLPRQPMKDTARIEIDKGIDAYKSGLIDTAIRHFQKATELNSGLLLAKQHLADALARNVVTGLNTEANLEIARQAIDETKQVLATEPCDLNSLRKIAAL